MNLTLIYLQQGIEGIDYATLKNLLSNQNNIKSQNSGVVIFKDSRIIKCVENYYVRPNMPAIKKVANKCFYVQQALGVTGVANYSCARCHLTCMDLKKNCSIARKR